MNKYEKWYRNIVERAANRKLNSYSETHHIVPLCMGGGNEKENLVELTAEEHYVCHQLLVKIYPKNRKIIFAANMMSLAGPDQKRPNNKLYAWLRKKLSQALSSQRSNSAWINKNGVIKWISMDDLNSFLNDGWLRGKGKGTISAKQIEKMQQTRKDQFKQRLKEYDENPLKCSICGDKLKYENQKCRERRLKKSKKRIYCGKHECRSKAAFEDASEKRISSSKRKRRERPVLKECSCCGKKTKNKKFCSHRCNLKINSASAKGWLS